MMNPLEIKKLKDFSPLPIVLSILMFSIPIIILNPHLEMLGGTESTFDAALLSVRETLLERGTGVETGKKKNRLESQLERLDRWLPHESFLPDLIDRIGGLAEIFSVRITSVRYDFLKRGGDADPPRISIFFLLAAEYSAMREFLQALEYFPLPLLPVEISANNDRTFTMEVLFLIRP